MERLSAPSLSIPLPVAASPAPDVVSESPAPVRSMRPLAVWLIAGNLVVAALLILATWTGLQTNLAGDKAIARQTTESLAKSLSVEIGSELRLIDNGLATVALRYQRAETVHDQQRVIADTLSEQRGLLHHVAALRVTNALGVVHAGLGRGEQAISVADRDYFQRARATDAMVVSEPLLSRVTGQWCLIVARRLMSPDGEFAGIVYAVVSNAHFVDRFSQLAVGDGGAISLRTEDLRLIARYSMVEPRSTKGLGEITVSDALRQALASDREQGWYVSPTKLDQVERISVYRKVPGYPLFIMTGMSTETYLGPWRQEAYESAALIGGVILTIAGFSFLLFCKQRQERRAHEAMNRLAREQDLMLRNDLIGMVRARERVTTWENPALDQIFGYEPGELKGVPLRQLYLDDESYVHVGRVGYAALRAGERFRTQIQMRRKNGEPIWIDLSGTAVSETESLWMMVDIDSLKRSEEHAYGLAFRDALTGLPNRRLFEEKLGDSLAHAARGSRGLAVCYLDLDGFKPVNDEHGHDAGDEVLRTVGARLQATLRGNDVVARLGGDEFALVLNGVRGSEDVQPVLRRCLAEIQSDILLPSGLSVRVGASLGAVLGHGTAVNAADLMRRADEAMYAAKRAGKGRIHVGSLIGPSSALAAVPAPAPVPLDELPAAPTAGQRLTRVA